MTFAFCVTDRLMMQSACTLRIAGNGFTDGDAIAVNDVFK